MDILLYIIISFINVFLHIFRSILVIKSSKMSASFWNMVCYTFSAVVIKYIAEVDLLTAILVQATTNFVGCYLGMWAYERFKLFPRIRKVTPEDGLPNTAKYLVEGWIDGGNYGSDACSDLGSALQYWLYHCNISPRICFWTVKKLWKNESKKS